MRYFVAVAEELHFTRAAARLQMAQQPLSAAIARLEERLGVELLERTTRRVLLTEAGAAFLEGARAALAATESAVEGAVAAGRGATGRVALGVSSGAWYGLAELFEAVRVGHPGLHLDVRQQSARPAMAAVRSGTLDLAVVLCDRPPPDLESRRLKDEPVVLVLPSGHSEAVRDAVPLSAVRDESFALDDPIEGPGYNEAVLSLCARAGFVPEVVELQTHHDAWERAIATGKCVGVTTACSLHVGHPGVRAVRVAPRATFPFDLVWRPGRVRPAVQTVIDAALATADRYGWRARS